MAEDPYRVLNVSRGATSEEIQKSYRALARRYHPDVNPRAASAAVMATINAAYEVLSEPAKRAAYDRAYKKENSSVDDAVLSAARDTLLRQNWKLIKGKSDELILENGSRKVHVALLRTVSPSSIRSLLRNASSFAVILAVRAEGELRVPNESVAVIDLMRAVVLNGSFPDPVYQSLFARFL